MTHNLKKAIQRRVDAKAAVLQVSQGKPSSFDVRDHRLVLIPDNNQILDCSKKLIQAFYQVGADFKREKGRQQINLTQIAFQRDQQMLNLEYTFGYKEKPRLSVDEEYNLAEKLGRKRYQELN